jgi:hypothetical protein
MNETDYCVSLRGWISVTIRLGTRVRRCGGAENSRWRRWIKHLDVIELPLVAHNRHGARRHNFGWRTKPRRARTGARES